MNNKDYFSKVFRIAITTFVFGFYIAMVFFAFRQNWKFLLTSEYWIDTATATSLALMFRWLYSDSGVAKELNVNSDIAELEKGKGIQVAKVNKENLVDLLDASIKETNRKNKKQAYLTKCDKNINYYREKAWWKLGRKKKLAKWKKRKEEAYQDDFNIDTIRIRYYRYDLDEMLSTFYKQPNKERFSRTTKNQFVVSSLRTNVITLIAIMIYNALDILIKDFSSESLVVLFGKLIIFTVNIYTGFNLGREFIRNMYSSNLTEDYTYLKTFLKQNGVE